MKDLTIEEWSFLPLEKLHHLTVENGLANTYNNFNLGMNFNH